MRISDWSSDVCSSDLARLLRQRDAPGGEAGARHQDGNAHLHRLDHHLRGEPPGGVEDLVVRRDAVQQHVAGDLVDRVVARSEEHTSELQSLMRISYAVFCLKKKINK